MTPTEIMLWMVEALLRLQTHVGYLVVLGAIAIVWDMVKFLVQSRAAFKMVREQIASYEKLVRG